jgi:glyoxylase-like metal-dependent hydrolase (beta-lactamase superfamily II)/rhodanese-related sulfurtransferase
MFVQQFFVKGLAHSSYLLGGTTSCAIIDPRRDVQIYLDAAKAMNMRITHIIETHLHADFVSGHLDLALLTGATIYMPKSAECAFEHAAVVEGDEIELDDLRLKVLETPGHTPEHVSYVVTDTARGPEPVCVFCGDTLFVGDVGRPDLFPGRAEELADQLYHSLHDKLLQLPGYCEVLPAHGAGSLCGRAMGAKRTSTIGYEKLYNRALQLTDQAEFVKSLTTNMPPAPDHFSRCSAINRQGPACVEDLPALSALPPGQFAQLAADDNVTVLDTRSYDAFGGQHVCCSYQVDFGGNFATFAGWILPPEKEIVLVSSDAGQAREAVTWLRRVGLDNATAYLDGGTFAWARAGYPTGHVGQLSVQELNRRMTDGPELQLVDVRAPGEYAATHIEGAVNIPAPDLRTRHAELKPDVAAALICSTGHRSSLGAALLLQQGFVEVYNIAGGMTGYAAAGLGQECPMCIAPHGPRFLGT